MLFPDVSLARDPSIVLCKKSLLRIKWNWTEND
jgi:hypothetical protein